MKELAKYMLEYWISIYSYKQFVKAMVKSVTRVKYHYENISFINLWFEKREFSSFYFKML